MVFRVVSDPPVIINRPNESLETVSPLNGGAAAGKYCGVVVLNDVRESGMLGTMSVSPIDVAYGNRYLSARWGHHQNFLSCAQQSGLAAEIANSRPKLVMSAVERRVFFIIDCSRVRRIVEVRSIAIARHQWRHGNARPTLLRVSSARLRQLSHRRPASRGR